MNHSHNRRHQPHNLTDPPLRRDIIIADIRRPVPPRLIPEADHVPGLRIELGVGGERDTGQLSVEGLNTLGLERPRVHRVGRRILLQR